MNLTEANGKALFHDYHIPVPKGIEVFTVKKLSNALKTISTKKVVVKAQIPVGSRGKAGGVVAAYTDQLSAVEYAVGTLLDSVINGCKVKSVLLEEEATITKELYLSITIDRSTKQYLLLFSKQGGVDIETLASANPKAIARVPFVDLTPKILQKAFGKHQFQQQLKTIAKKVFTLMKEKDALLVEINPLVISTSTSAGSTGTSKKKLIALDAKIAIDDNALFRQRFSFADESMTPIEKKAQEYGLHYVELEGDIAVIGNGAGMVMATLDMIAANKGKAANFLDLRGGTGKEAMEKALELCLMKKGIKGLLINIFAGITHCDEIANGIVEYCKQQNMAKNKRAIPMVPIVVRMIGTNQNEGRAILEKIGIHAMDDSEQAAQKIVKLVKLS